MKKSFYFIIILTIFSFFLRAYRITEPNHYYFDEVYHVVTAKAYADNNPAPYDPFSPPPKEGTAYDWLHPPLAKLIQAGSIKIFGDRPIGWRLPSLVFGTAIIPATFFLGLILFNPGVAVFSSTVIAFENLTFVMARITMNDVFITFFSIVSFYFLALYFKSKRSKHLLLTSIFLGLAVSSKWTGVYAVVVAFGFLLLEQLRAKRLKPEAFFLLVIPAILYLGSYGQFWLQGHTIRNFIDLHKQIWWYQNTRNLKHSYATTPLYCVPDGLDGARTWCPWILDIRGVYFSYEQYGENAGYIYAIGNPFIFWAGIIGVSYLLGRFFEERKKEQALVLGAYFIFWSPWIFSPRIMFLYHYLPSMPFLSIGLGYSLYSIWKTKFAAFSLIVILVAIGFFFFLYPISSGYPIKIDSIDKFMLINRWR